MRSEIELQQVTFTGGIHYDETGHVYIEETAGPRFVGLPEPAIDEAWESLLRGTHRNVVLGIHSEINIDLQVRSSTSRQKKLAMCWIGRI